MNIFIGGLFLVLDKMHFASYVDDGPTYKVEKTLVNDTLNASGNFKNKQKSVWSNVLIGKSMCILKANSIHWTLRKNANVEKNFFGQNKWHKNALFFLSRGTTHHSFTCNLRSLYELKRKVRLSKTVWVFLFRFRLVFTKVYIFVQQNAWTLWP